MAMIRTGATRRSAIACAMAAACAHGGEPPEPGDLAARRAARVENGVPPPELVDGARMSQLTERMQAHRTPALSIAKFERGQIEWARGYGVATLEGGATAADTLFQAASISKAVSALGAMRLVDMGLIGLDDDVNAYLRGWRVPANEWTLSVPVTLRRLLSHTAGVNVPSFAGYARGATIPTVAEILEGEPPTNNVAIRLETMPGAEFRYSGGGYVILQQLMSDVASESFAALMQRLVFDPLEMRQSTFAQPLTPAFAGQAAAPYDEDGHPLEGGAHLYPELAAAGLWTTPTDLAKFALGVQVAIGARPESILSAAGARTMLTPIMNYYGLGPQIAGANERKFFFKSGANAGFSCRLAAYFEGDGAVIMTNRDNGHALADEALRAIAYEYDWPDFGPARGGAAAQ